MENWILGFTGVIVTVFIFLLGMIKSRTEKNEDSINNVHNEIEQHKLHSSYSYATKEETVKLIGLISGPIQKSVDDVKNTFKENQREHKEELKHLHDKLDQLLANQAARRLND